MKIMISAQTSNKFEIFYNNTFTVNARSVKAGLKKGIAIVDFLVDNKSTGLKKLGVMAVACDEYQKDFPIVVSSKKAGIRGHIKVNNLTNGGYYVNKIADNMVTLLINQPSLLSLND